jgi:hypothetical protein
VTRGVRLSWRAGPSAGGSGSNPAPQRSGQTPSTEPPRSKTPWCGTPPTSSTNTNEQHSCDHARPNTLDKPRSLTHAARCCRQTREPVAIVDRPSGHDSLNEMFVACPGGRIRLRGLWWHGRRPVDRGGRWRCEREGQCWSYLSRRSSWSTMSTATCSRDNRSERRDADCRVNPLRTRRELSPRSTDWHVHDHCFNADDASALQSETSRSRHRCEHRS